MQKHRKKNHIFCTKISRSINCSGSKRAFTLNNAKNKYLRQIICNPVHILNWVCLAKMVILEKNAYIIALCLFHPRKTKRSNKEPYIAFTFRISVSTFFQAPLVYFRIVSPFPFNHLSSRTHTIFYLYSSYFSHFLLTTRTNQNCLSEHNFL